MSNSLNRQESSVLKEADRLEVEIVKWWSGNVSSKAGTNVKRKDLTEIQEFCKSNKRVKYLIVDEPDRFMRSVNEGFYFETVFELLGVKVWYACDPALNTGDLMSKMLKFSKYLPAEGSNIERQNKSINGLKERFLAGYYPSHTHQGYVKGSIAGLHEPDPIRFPLLQKAAKDVLSREVSVTDAMIETQCSWLHNPTK